MKSKIIVILAILMAGSATVYGQSKKELQDELNALQSKYDSLLAKSQLVDSVVTDSGVVVVNLDTLMAENARLSAALDSTYRRIVYALSMVMDSLDPNMEMTEVQSLMDSLEAHPEMYSLEGLQNRVKSVQDSVALLIRSRDSLARDNKTIKELFQFLVGGNQHPQSATDLTGQWTLVLSEVQMVGDSTGGVGLITRPTGLVADSMKDKVLKKLDLVDAELAELEFFSGRKTRCFYKVNNFSKEKPYYIDLRNMDDINIRMFVNHNYNGVQISYQVANGPYLFGYMKK